MGVLVILYYVTCLVFSKCLHPISDMNDDSDNIDKAEDSLRDQPSTSKSSAPGKLN